MTKTVELFPKSQVSVTPYANSKGSAKLIVRVDAALMERIVIERDADEVQRFLDSVQFGGTN